jgi:hypothetical protein
VTHTDPLLNLLARAADGDQQAAAAYLRSAADRAEHGQPVDPVTARAAAVALDELAGQDAPATVHPCDCWPAYEHSEHCPIYVASVNADQEN